MKLIVEMDVAMVRTLYKWLDKQLNVPMSGRADRERIVLLKAQRALLDAYKKGADNAP